MSFQRGAMLQRPIIIKKIKVADHIGIYMGNNEVIHFGYPVANKVIKTSLEQFAGDTECFNAISVKQYAKDEEHQVIICEKAELLLSNQQNGYNEKYSVFYNNCEDFARECYQTGNGGYITNDQWENIRGKVGEKSAKLIGEGINTLGTMAREFGRDAITKSAGVTARSAIKGAVSATYKTSVGKKAIESIAKSATGKSIHGGAAINNVSKVARGNMVVGAVTTVVLTGPDLYRAIFDKSVSWQQVSKNLTTNGAMVAGGIGGWAAGAAIGTSICPGVGTIIGGLVGSFAASTAAEKGSKMALDLICEDDADKMMCIVKEELIRICNKLKLTEEEVQELVMPALEEKMDIEWLREMYKSGTTDIERAEFAYSQCYGICLDIKNNRSSMQLGNDIV